MVTQRIKMRFLPSLRLINFNIRNQSVVLPFCQNRNCQITNIPTYQLNAIAIAPITSGILDVI